jgi:membrane associated rhomboid family serine protease
MPTLPPVTKALMLICAVVYCLQVLLPSLPVDELFALWPLNSGRFWPWQVVSYSLLHGSLAHLLLNMLGLWLFGSDLERLWGRNRYLSLIGASLLTAAVAQLLTGLLLGSMAPTIGASGAIFGLLLAYGLVFSQRQFDLMGFLPMLLMMVPIPFVNMIGLALFVVMLTSRASLSFLRPIPIRALTMVAVYGAAELFMGVTGTGAGIAHFAHLGGMLGAWLMISWWRGKLPFSRGGGGSRRR